VKSNIHARSNRQSRALKTALIIIIICEIVIILDVSFFVDFVVSTNEKVHTDINI